MLRQVFRYGLIIALVWQSLAMAQPAAAKDAPSPTVTPVPRQDDWWQNRQKSFNERVAQGNVDLLLIGDSITEGWGGAGNDAWKTYYAPRNAVNLGIGGDRTEHVLWRLDHGNVDNIKPKLAVLMIGTNNSGDNSAEQIGEGIVAVVHKLREKLPETKVLILAVFPRGPKPDATREKLAKASQIAAAEADDKNVFFLDIGPKFLEPDGELKPEIMPDYLHLSPKGYLIWADAIEPKVVELMGEKK